MDQGIRRVRSLEDKSRPVFSELASPLHVGRAIVDELAVGMPAGVWASIRSITSRSIMSFSAPGSSRSMRLFITVLKELRQPCGTCLPLYPSRL